MQEVLAGVGMLDATVGEVLQANGDFVLAMRAEVPAQCHVIAEIERCAEPLVAAAVHRGDEVDADAAFQEPCGGEPGLIAEHRRDAELTYQGRRSAVAIHLRDRSSEPDVPVAGDGARAEPVCGVPSPDENQRWPRQCVGRSRAGRTHPMAAGSLRPLHGTWAPQPR